MREQSHNVPVLAVELQLHLGLVLLKVLRAHDLPSDEAGSQARRPAPASGAVASEPAINSTIGPSPAQSSPADPTRAISLSGCSLCHSSISKGPPRSKGPLS